MGAIGRVEVAMKEERGIKVVAKDRKATRKKLDEDVNRLCKGYNLFLQVTK